MSSLRALLASPTMFLHPSSTGYASDRPESRPKRLVPSPGAETFPSHQTRREVEGDPVNLKYKISTPKVYNKSVLEGDLL